MTFLILSFDWLLPLSIFENKELCLGRTFRSPSEDSQAVGAVYEIPPVRGFVRWNEKQRFLESHFPLVCVEFLFSNLNFPLEQIFLNRL